MLFHFAFPPIVQKSSDLSTSWLPRGGHLICMFTIPRPLRKVSFLSSFEKKKRKTQHRILIGLTWTNPNNWTETPDSPILDQVPSSWHMLEILEPHGLKKHLPADTVLGIFKTNFSLRLSFPSVSLYLCVYKMTTMSLLNKMTSADR